MANGAEESHGGCRQTVLTAAYLDGELDAAHASGFERHLRECGECSAALREQRRLLCLLDSAFDETFGKRVALPANFTREVRARAQTDMSGVRDAGERLRALKICVALTVAACALLGVAVLDTVVVPLLNGARSAGSVFGTAGHAAADAGAGAGVVLRAVGGRIMTASEPFLMLRWAAFTGALALLLFLISRYHRARG